LAVDFGLLSASEQALLTQLATLAPPATLADRGALPGSASEIAAALLHLERLGVVRSSACGVEVASEIVAGWLREHCARPKGLAV
jgi:hypothetical protein